MKMPEDQNTAAKTFTEADIRDRFVSKDVFQDRLQGKTARISELEAKLGDYQRQLLEAQPRLAKLEELSAELGKRDAAVQAAEDRVALARAGVTDDGAVGFLRMAFDQHGKLPHYRWERRQAGALGRDHQIPIVFDNVPRSVALKREPIVEQAGDVCGADVGHLRQG